MVKLELIRGLSYKDRRICATKSEPEVLVDDIDTAKHYENTGFFKILGEAGTDTAVAAGLFTARLCRYRSVAGR